MKATITRSALTCASTLGLMAAVPALTLGTAVAQEMRGQQPTAARTIDEIVVTSRRRGEELLQEVPATITAFSGDQLDRLGALNFDEFAYHVPGLTFDDEGPGQKRYTVRGIQSAGQQQTAVYYDDIPLPGVQTAGGNSGSQTPDLKLFDMERIEVLRGPQGTTFGANSQAGTVRFITRKPVMNEVEGRIKVGVHTISKGGEGGDFYAMLNLPLVEDRLALRTVAFYDREAGYLDNNRLQLNNYNWVETHGGRATLRWTPADNVTIDAQAWVQRRDNGGTFRYNPFDSFSDDPDNLDFVDGNLNPLTEIRQMAFAQTGDLVNIDYARTEQPDNMELYSLAVEWDTPFAVVTANAGYFKRDYFFKRDSTWVVMNLGARFDGFDDFDPVRPDLIPALTDQAQDLRQRSMELKLHSVGDSPLQWVGGVYWRERDSNFRSFVPVVDDRGRVFDPGTPFGTPGEPGAGIPECHPCVFARVNTRNIEEIAVFGELSYELTDQWEVSVGGRWYEAEQADVGNQAFPFALFPPGDPPADLRSFKEDQFLTKFQVSYRPMDTMTLYALASEGYRLGGTNQRGIVAVPPGYESDNIWNYEFGIKTSWLNNRLIVNSALFWIDWENIQVAGSDPTGAFGFIGNAGEAEVRGVEFEAYARPTDNWDLSMGFTWLEKRELTEDQITDEVVAPGRAGDKIQFIPGFTANATARYTFNLPVDGWDAFIGGEFVHRGSSNSQLDTTSRFNRRQNSFEIFNFRVGAVNIAEDLDLTFYVRNAFDKRGDLRVRTEDSLLTVKWTNQPRTFGMDLSKRF